jgi:tRNA (guanine9-N1)-methyltransferase
MAETSTPLSKSAQKKALKAERRATHKLERRAREKQAKKDKKRVLAEKRAAGQLDQDERELEEKRRKRRKVNFGARVVVDLGFDQLMNEKVSGVIELLR